MCHQGRNPYSSSKLAFSSVESTVEVSTIVSSRIRCYNTILLKNTRFLVQDAIN